MVEGEQDNQNNNFGWNHKKDHVNNNHEGVNIHTLMSGKDTSK